MLVADETNLMQPINHDITSWLCFLHSGDISATSRCLC